MKDDTFRINVSQIENNGLRRVIIVALYPLMVVANAFFWLLLGLYGALCSPVAIFNSARRIW